jgi:hypothetical protein
MTAKCCPDCAALPGEWHARGCDIEQCACCGGQAVHCDTDDHSIPLDDRLPWTGLWPREAEAIKYGWYCNQTPNGWRSCGPDHPDGVPDLNRVRREMVWERDTKRYAHKRSGVT